MNDNRYIRAMEHIVPDEDFERRTLNKLNASRRPGRRAARILIPCTAALACVLVLAIALPSMLATPPVPAPDQSEPNGSHTPPISAPAARSKGAAPVSEAAGMPGLAEYDAAWEGAFMMAPGSYEPFNTEEYAAVSESGFRVASTSPLSTFAADVDTAGYTNVRRMLLEGSLPDVDSVRIEEMLNYFGYGAARPRGRRARRHPYRPGSLSLERQGRPALRGRRRPGHRGGKTPPLQPGLPGGRQRLHGRCE